ncbi:MAG: AAA family ATPase, partial [Chromatiales bacterium]|nr:AAA family ATPase [Chromatiales bacterium]
RLDHLSGGQFQLVLIWATLASGSDLVLLDEPTNHLDPAAVDVLCRLLTEGADERAVLVVSHEAAFLSRVCSRVVELVAGYDADA